LICVFIKLAFKISTYPRKGTKTPALRSSSTPSCHFNLSPQGDENPRYSSTCTVLSDFNLSPQGDENAQYAKGIDGGDPISTYPRKGTKT